MRIKFFETTFTETKSISLLTFEHSMIPFQTFTLDNGLKVIVHEDPGEHLREGSERAEVHVVSLSLPGQQGVQRVMHVVVPLTVPFVPPPTASQATLVLSP